jgi:hypothetical protein
MGNAFKDFATVYRHFGRGTKTQFDAIAVHFQHDDLDIFADANCFL